MWNRFPASTCFMSPLRHQLLKLVPEDPSWRTLLFPGPHRSLHFPVALRCSSDLCRLSHWAASVILWLCWSPTLLLTWFLWTSFPGGGCSIMLLPSNVPLNYSTGWKWATPLSFHSDLLWFSYLPPTEKVLLRTWSWSRGGFGGRQSALCCVLLGDGQSREDKNYTDMQS